ncbi:hypothetical protein [Chryseobacterium sp. ISL-6]|uniref:hypothetical protein n=1 Tax=Chryseobacterium sp. ISL-6 TaxID=2819143 RepID=UPI001BE6CC44|nr:hypothetical protein [Chryseobacterium sp. ISL-6]MBT2619695.1 hypothetical protein [Chryseobacterium sp. ISL-6]
MKNKKIYISLIVFIAVFSSIAFLMGYRIPQWDKHRDWVFMPENKDPFFEIEKTDIKTDFVLHIPNGKGYILLLKNGDFITVTAITEKGKIIKRFPKTKDFYIDSLNQRFIFSKEIYKSDDHLKKQLISYRFTDYQKQENRELNDFIIEETQAEFLKRKGYSIKDFLKDNEKKELDSLYLKEKTKEANFYKTLYPVTKVSIAYEALDTEFYTNKNGQLYTVEETKVKTNNIEDVWNSLYLLFPNYKKKMSVQTLTKNMNTYVKTDEPTIESNFIHTHYLRVSFRQHHINYFSIPFGTKNFNFKYKERTLAYPEQLNIPKNDMDTLACIIDNTLYRIYPKTNKIKK